MHESVPVHTPALHNLPSIILPSLLAGSSYSRYSDVPSLVATNETGGDEAEHSKRGTPCVLGVDEAGRGPVIGPMVYSALYLPVELQQQLLATAHHFNDSKVLRPDVRARLMDLLCQPGSDLFEACGWAVKSLSARDVGADMMRNGGSYNLNAQAMDATTEIIRGVLHQGVDVQQVFIDTVGNPLTYQKKMERIFPTIKITVEKKADSLFPCVSAASVVAKVTRDVSCETLFQNSYKDTTNSGTETEETGWGSGYPSDSKCITWLKSSADSLFGWGNECRFSWGTVKDILDHSGNGAIMTDWPDDRVCGNSILSDYFSTMATNGQTEKQQLHSWYGVRAGADAF